MAIWVLREVSEALGYIVEGFWLSSLEPPLSNPEVTIAALDWACYLVADGLPLPPMNFMVDVGLLACGRIWRQESSPRLPLPYRDASLVRLYENRFVARLPLDANFERAAAAVSRYPQPDRRRALAFLLRQMAQHLRLSGAQLSLEILRRLQQTIKEPSGYNIWHQYQPRELSDRMRQWFNELLGSLRLTPVLFSTEDATALEDRSALGGRAQMLAIRQIRQLIDHMEPYVHQQIPHAQQLPVGWLTRIFVDDQYPVGGYAAITNRGSLENLLHSQLAYIDEEKPDLFEIKYLRNELLYYSRDENLIARRRKVFVFLFSPDLVCLRFKDPELPYERMILLLACIVLAIHRLTTWLTYDSVRCEIRSLQTIAGQGNPTTLHLARGPHMERDWEEFDWLRLLLRSEIDKGLVTIGTWSTMAKAIDAIQQWKQHANVYCLAISSKTVDWQIPEGTMSAVCLIDKPYPHIVIGAEKIESDEDCHLIKWIKILNRLLELWMS
jgi:hypothetical protein